MPLDDPDQPASTERLVFLLRTTASEGVMARGLLEADGIPVFTKGESEGPYRLSVMDLWVPEAFEVQARTILADLQASSTQAEEAAEVQHDLSGDDAERGMGEGSV
jgi:hypothetical protein